MDWKTAITLSVTVLVAGLGYLYNRKLAQRKDRLDRVNRQLSELYGPLIALSAAANSAWAVFRTKYRPSGGFWSDPPPSESEAAAWRLWIGEVFMPLNRRMMEIVVSRADLLEETDMPDCLLDLCAHVASYAPIVRRWEQGDHSEHASPLRFPRKALLEYTELSFRTLKERQAALLGPIRIPKRADVSNG